MNMTDSEMAAFAMTMWINYIQTGDHNLSAEDAKRIGEPVNPLTEEQIRGLARMFDIRKRILNGALEGE